MGLGFYLPFSIVLTYSIGTLLRVLSDWKLGHGFAEDVGIPVSAGLIVGEALVGVGFAIHMILGADENGVRLEQDGSEVTLDFGNIAKAKLVPDYEKILAGHKTK